MGLLIKGDFETEKGQSSQIYCCLESFCYDKRNNTVKATITYWNSAFGTRDGSNNIVPTIIAYTQASKKGEEVNLPNRFIFDLDEEVETIEPIFEIKEVIEEVPYVSFDENGDEITKYRQILTEKKIKVGEENKKKKVKNIDLIKEDVFKTIYNRLKEELEKFNLFDEINNI